MDDDPLAGRICGPCTVCCTALTIDQPELQKLPGYTCANCVQGEGCAIYETRPGICRSWFCGWRQLDWVADGLRPDRSDILIYLTEERIPEGYATDIGLEFTILAERGLKAEGLAEALSHSIRAGIATFVNVPGRPGQSGARLLVNDALKEAAETGQMPALRQGLQKLYLSLAFLGGADSLKPITLTDYTAQGEL